MRRTLSLSKTNTLCRLVVQAMSCNRRVKLIAHLSGRPCPLYATIFDAVIKDRIAGEGMRNEEDLLGAVAVCDEHRANVLEFFHILQGLTIKQDNLALLTWDKC